MTENPKQPGRIEELPDCIEHLRKIAKRLKLDHPEYAADDPTRTVNTPGSGYREFGPNLQGLRRGRHP